MEISCRRCVQSWAGGLWSAGPDSPSLPTPPEDEPPHHLIRYCTLPTDVSPWAPRALSIFHILRGWRQACGRSHLPWSPRQGGRAGRGGMSAAQVSSSQNNQMQKGRKKSPGQRVTQCPWAGNHLDSCSWLPAPQAGSNAPPCSRHGLSKGVRPRGPSWPRAPGSGLQLPLAACPSSTEHPGSLWDFSIKSSGSDLLVWGAELLQRCLAILISSGVAMGRRGDVIDTKKPTEFTNQLGLELFINTFFLPSFTEGRRGEELPVLSGEPPLCSPGPGLPAPRAARPGCWATAG